MIPLSRREGFSGGAFRWCPGVCLALVLGCWLLATAAAQRAGRVSGAVQTSSGKGSSSGLTPVARKSLDAAIAALQANSLPEAERQARAAVTASPGSAVTHNILGVVLDRGGRKEQAFIEFDAAIKIDPGFVSARNNRGRMLAEHGRTTEAIAEFERVLKTDPAHVQAHYNLGALYADAGDFGKAAEHFAFARQADPNDPQLAMAFLNVAYRAGRTQEADQAANLVERIAGSDAKSLFTLATVLAESKRYAPAARLFGRVNQITPHTFEVLYNLGVSLYNLDRNDEAATYLAEAADLNPDPAETHFRLALVASAQDDHRNAIIEFRHAIEREPGCLSLPFRSSPGLDPATRLARGGLARSRGTRTGHSRSHQRSPRDAARGSAVAARIPIPLSVRVCPVLDGARHPGGMVPAAARTAR